MARRFTVQKNRRYRATVTLSFFERWASNDMVADEFRKVGFTEVDVRGTGGTRKANGLWPHDDASAEIPDQVSDIEVIEV